MATATRTPPPHGTEYRYCGPADGAWPGCRCKECTRAQTIACKRRRLAHHRGQSPLYPGAPLVEHITACRDAGMSYALIARRAKVADATITYLVRGLTKSCARDKALRILAVRPGDFDTIADQPALGSVRRLRALYVRGHNPDAIGAVAKLATCTVSYIANGRYHMVTSETAEAIRRAYAELSDRVGTSRKAKKRAKDLGWAGPEYWDDDDFDNPDFTPALSDDVGRRALAAHRRAEIARLDGFGVPEQDIARRLEMDDTYVHDLIVNLRRAA